MTPHTPMWIAMAGIAAFNVLALLGICAEIDAMRKRLDRAEWRRKVGHNK